MLDQSSSLSDVRARAMFCAHGLYCGEKFFAILDGGRLFFKTDGESVKGYLERGMESFSYEQCGKVITFQYHEVPPEILEQPMELVLWARKAIQLATGKPPKPKKQSQQR